MITEQQVWRCKKFLISALLSNSGNWNGSRSRPLPDLCRMWFHCQCSWTPRSESWLCKMQRNGQRKTQCWTCPDLWSFKVQLCMYVWLHNESRSESLYEAACLLHKECGSSRKSGHGANRYVCGLFWPLLRMCVYHDTQPIGIFVSWFSCNEMLALSVLLLFLQYPTCKDDYRTSQTTVHC